MIWILVGIIWLLIIMITIRENRICRLKQDLEFWRNEAIRLRNEKHK